MRTVPSRPRFELISREIGGADRRLYAAPAFRPSRFVKTGRKEIESQQRFGPLDNVNDLPAKKHTAKKLLDSSSAVSGSQGQLDTVGPTLSNQRLTQAQPHGAE